VQRVWVTGGHANLGTAHGAAGILAFLSLATIAGHAIDGQTTAIATLCGWYDTWEQNTGDGPWWPEWLPLADLRAGHPSQHAPGRPSWCYGTPGIARALQLAAIATNDPIRQAAAEYALAKSLQPQRLAQLTTGGLCHGLAGTYQTAIRAVADAITPDIAIRLPDLASLLTSTGVLASDTPELIAGQAGTRLALETLHRAAPPLSGWDSCLLLT
jgi:hypothetical protein